MSEKFTNIEEMRNAISEFEEIKIRLLKAKSFVDSLPEKEKWINDIITKYENDIKEIRGTIRNEINAQNTKINEFRESHNSLFSAYKTESKIEIASLNNGINHISDRIDKISKDFDTFKTDQTNFEKNIRNKLTYFSIIFILLIGILFILYLMK